MKYALEVACWPLIAIAAAVMLGMNLVGRIVEGRK